MIFIFYSLLTYLGKLSWRWKLAALKRFNLFQWNSSITMNLG